MLCNCIRPSRANKTPEALNYIFQHQQRVNKFTRKWKFAVQASLYLVKFTHRKFRCCHRKKFRLQIDRIETNEYLIWLSEQLRLLLVKANIANKKRTRTNLSLFPSKKKHFFVSSGSFFLSSVVLQNDDLLARNSHMIQSNKLPQRETHKNEISWYQFVSWLFTRNKNVAMRT